MLVRNLTLVGVGNSTYKWYSGLVMLPSWVDWSHLVMLASGISAGGGAVGVLTKSKRKIAMSISAYLAHEIDKRIIALKGNQPVDLDPRLEQIERSLEELPANLVKNPHLMQAMRHEIHNVIQGMMPICSAGGDCDYFQDSHRNPRRNPGT